jgi:predicted DCC family thiol-disulfide oxidoreductase YuxK
MRTETSTAHPAPLPISRVRLLLPLLQLDDMLYLLTLYPSWVRPHPVGPADLVFYDGHCGLCHRSVRIRLAADHSGATFRFAPLDSAVFRQAVTQADRRTLPDSFVVVTAAGVILSRAKAVRYVLGRLGGLWRVLSCMAGMVPNFILDSAYDTIARMRTHVFTRPEQTCPIAPEPLRQRFLI